MFEQFLQQNGFNVVENVYSVEAANTTKISNQNQFLQQLQTSGTTSVYVNNGVVFFFAQGALGESEVYTYSP